jgi:hypothetical protein
MPEAPAKGENSARFVLRGSFRPEDVTEFVGVPATNVARAGELVSELTDYRRIHSIWEVRSDLPESLPIGTHIKSILERLEPRWQQFVELGKRYEAGILCRVYAYDSETPEVYFARELVKRIAELGAYIDVDVYCLPSNGDT